MQKVSEWLRENVASHDILAHDDLHAAFIDETGEFAEWPTHTVADANKAIEKRGLGGNCNGDDDDIVAYGWEIAEALAYKYGNKFRSGMMGRGSIFRECVAAIEAQEKKVAENA